MAKHPRVIRGIEQDWKSIKMRGRSTKSEAGTSSLRGKSMIASTRSGEYTVIIIIEEEAAEVDLR